MTTLQGGPHLAQGAEVAVVTLEGEAEAPPLRFVLRAGYETAERLYDAQTAHAQPPTRLQAWSLVDRRSEGAFYLARFVCPKARRFHALEIDYTAPEGRLLVFGGSLGAHSARGMTLSPFMDERYRRVREEGGSALYENRTAPPRAFAVHRLVRVEASADAVREIAGGTLRPSETVVVEDPTAPTPTGRGPSTVSMRTDEPRLVELDAEMQGDGYVVLADTSYPGWQATIDGAPVPIYTANGLFRTVFVRSGRHRVRFEYTPKALHRGLAVTLATALIALMLVLVPERRSFTRPAATRS